MSKVLTVFGATGNQGGSVIKSVLAHPSLSNTFKIRAVTRDSSKPAAQKLAQKGCEVVVADLSDSNSVQKAVQGAFAVFSVTDFWSHMSKDTEVTHGKTVVDAARAAGVKHFIWSGLPHVTKLTQGQLKHVLHFDGKAEVSEYIESIKGNDMISTYFMPAYYMSNLTSVTRPSGDGQYALTIPEGDGNSTQIPMIDIENDTGTYVAAILAADPVSINGQYIQAVSEWVTPNQVAQALSKATGKQFKYNDIDPEVWAGFLPPPVATELKENMVLIRDYSYYGKGTEKKQLDQDKLLNISKKVSLEEWAKANAAKWQ